MVFQKSPFHGLSSHGEGEKIEQLGEKIALLKDPSERKKQQRGSTGRVQAAQHSHHSRAIS